MGESTRRARVTGIGLALVLACGAALADGVVEVSFQDSARFTDIGWTPAQQQQSLQVLKEHMARWSRQLPDGQRLSVTVTDVDLAGETRVLWRHPDVRVLRGSTDFPRMSLRWTLTDSAGRSRSGESRLSDPAYLQHGAALDSGELLAHDRRMLDRWLRETVPEASH